MELSSSKLKKTFYISGGNLPDSKNEKTHSQIIFLYLEKWNILDRNLKTSYIFSKINFSYISAENLQISKIKSFYFF